MCSKLERGRKAAYRSKTAESRLSWYERKPNDGEHATWDIMLGTTPSVGGKNKLQLNICSNTFNVIELCLCLRGTKPSWKWISKRTSHEEKQERMQLVELWSNRKVP